MGLPNPAACKEVLAEENAQEDRLREKLESRGEAAVDYFAVAENLGLQEELKRWFAAEMTYNTDLYKTNGRMFEMQNHASLSSLLLTWISICVGLFLTWYQMKSAAEFRNKVLEKLGHAEAAADQSTTSVSVTPASFEISTTLSGVAIFALALLFALLFSRNIYDIQSLDNPYKKPAVGTEQNSGASQY